MRDVDLYALAAATKATVATASSSDCCLVGDDRKRATEAAIEALGASKRASLLYSDRKQITIPITRRQHEALSTMARESGVTMREILIVALMPFMGDP